MSGKVNLPFQSVKLLKELAGFYHYDLEITSGGEVRMTPQLAGSAAVKKYATTEAAIGAWLSVMLNTNRNRTESGQAPMWTVEELSLARQLQSATGIQT